jgi:hypothetical protein
VPRATNATHANGDTESPPSNCELDHELQRAGVSRTSIRESPSQEVGSYEVKIGSYRAPPWARGRVQ